MDSRRTHPLLVMAIANAIAFAEGFYRPGSTPRTCNNPGDLKHAADHFKIIDRTKSGIIHFESVIYGWGALYWQVALMLDNLSHVYDSTMTINDVSLKWTATAAEQQGWAISVAWHLRVTPETRLYDIEAEMKRVCAL